MLRRLWLLLLVLALVACGGRAATPTDGSAGNAAASTPASDDAVAPAAEPITLRVGVSLDAPALASFQAGVQALDTAHPEWVLELEAVPQDGRLERISTEIASSTLPDVVLLDGLSAQQWIRQGAFADMTPLVAQDGLDLSAFFADTVAQFAWDGKQWGLPADAAPEVVYFNKAMFDAAGLDYPTDDWTLEDMRAAARLLTLDSEGRNSTDPDFDAESIVQWGWNSAPSNIWTRNFVQPLGADPCVNADCTQLDLTSPDVVAAYGWWADLVQKDHAAPYDPYSGAQTGVPGDPFVAGKAAMGFSNIAQTAQLNDQSQIQYDIVQPFKGTDGQRYGPLSTRGYVIAANTPHPAEAWQLIQALTSDEFLTQYVGQPGHSIPARRSAAPSALNPDKEPQNQEAALQAMEYEQVFRPFTASAFETYGKTAGLFTEAMKGDRPLAEVLAEIEQVANETLAADMP